MKEWEIRKYWNSTEDEFKGIQEESIQTFDKYKDYVVGILKVTPAIPDKNVMFKLKEAFHDFDIFTSAVYRYLKSLRKEYGLISSKKIHKKKSESEEAQADFNQDNIIDIYGINRRV